MSFITSRPHPASAVSAHPLCSSSPTDSRPSPPCLQNSSFWIQTFLVFNEKSSFLLTVVARESFTQPPIKAFFQISWVRSERTRRQVHLRTVEQRSNHVARRVRLCELILSLLLVPAPANTYTEPFPHFLCVILRLNDIIILCIHWPE